MAAACGGIEQHNPLSENHAALLDSLSPWKQITPINTIHQSSSYAQIFRELLFKDNIDLSHFEYPPEPSFSSSPFANPMFSIGSSPKSDEFGNSSAHREKDGSFDSDCHGPCGQKKQYKHSDSFSSVNSDTLSICTEGLGLESSDDVDDLVKNEICNNYNDCEEREKTSFTRNTPAEKESHRAGPKRSGTGSRVGVFPPPISCIGKSGKPFVTFKSFREDGRFILKEIRIPTQEVLHASRENGRLKLQLILSDYDDDDGDIIDDNEVKGNDEGKNDKTGENGNGDGEEW